MTDAQARAVEAAARRVANDLGISWGGLNDNARAKMFKMLANAIATRDATMAEAGWVMVRVPQEVEPRFQRHQQWVDGFNLCRRLTLDSACRAAMMKGATDEQG